ncbi:MAG: hypothetical protein N3I35_14155 [Clostridia bacterium]|nr:hypothetical protein [Clostridia bacterium]
MNILDVLLLPKKVYEKLTGKRHTLVLGIVLLGVADLLFDLFESRQRILVGKVPSVLYFNITLTIVVTILVGLIDVLFFSLPLFDLFKYFKKEKSISNTGEHLVKLMKIYICANMLVIPINTVFHLIFSREGFEQNPMASVLLSIYILIIPLWISAVVSRGANAIYGFVPQLRKMVFLAVFIWSSILWHVLGYIVDTWLIVLIK